MLSFELSFILFSANAANLVHYKFSQSSGKVFYDYSGLNNHG